MKLADQRVYEFQCRIKTTERWRVAGFRIANDDGWTVNGQRVKTEIPDAFFRLNFALFIVVSECLAYITFRFKKFLLGTSHIGRGNMVEFSYVRTTTEVQDRIQSFQVGSIWLGISLTVKFEARGTVDHSVHVFTEPVGFFVQPAFPRQIPLTSLCLSNALIFR